MNKLFAIALSLLLAFLVHRFTTQRGTQEQTQEHVSLATTLSGDMLDQFDPYGDPGQVIAREEFKETGTEGIGVVLPSFAWIVVQVEEVPNGNGRYKVGETCSVQEGGSATSTAFEAEDKVLVSYEHPKRVSPAYWNQSGQGYGAQCGNGTFFLMSKTVFNRLRDNTVSGQ